MLIQSLVHPAVDVALLLLFFFSPYRRKFGVLSPSSLTHVVGVPGLGKEGRESSVSSVCVWSLKVESRPRLVFSWQLGVCRSTYKQVLTPSILKTVTVFKITQYDVSKTFGTTLPSVSESNTKGAKRLWHSEKRAPLPHPPYRLFEWHYSNNLCESHQSFLFLLYLLIH